QVDTRLAPDEVDRGCQVLGVALAAARMGLREDALVSADGDADLRGARVDPEDQHFSPSAFLRPRGERLAQRSGAGVPSRTDGLDLDDAIVVTFAEAQVHLQEVRRQRGR